MKDVLTIVFVTFFVIVAAARPARSDEQISDWRGTNVRLQAGDVMSGGVRIHYHTAGDGPLLVQWADNELTLLVVPGAGHGPHAEMPEFVTPRIMDWLAARAHPQLKTTPAR